MDISIGELARITGISVKTIRCYSEIGLVPETGRTSAGYRRYNEGALARLELVRTVRDLGLDLVEEPALTVVVLGAALGDGGR